MAEGGSRERRGIDSKSGDHKLLKGNAIGKNNIGINTFETFPLKRKQKHIFFPYDGFEKSNFLFEKNDPLIMDH